MTKTLLTILFTLSVFSVAAKKDYSNSVKISSGFIYIKDRHQFTTPYDQAGLYYERRVYKNWFAGIGATEWVPVMPPGIPQHTRSVFEPNPNWTINGLELRIGYKMADAYVFYKWNVRGRHVVYGGIGASYCWGRNAYLKWFAVNPEPPSDIIGELYTKDVHYWGVLPCIGYDLLFLKKRLSIGTDIKYRLYIDRPQPELNWSLRLGVNF